MTRALDGVDPEALATTQLLVSELATNVVLHGGEEMAVDVTREPDRIRVEISDDGDGMPVKRHAGHEDDSGRGLGLVETAASTWGVRPEGQGKTVWFELSLAGQQPGRFRA